MDKREICKRIIVENNGLNVSLIQRELRLPLDLDTVVSLAGPRRCGKTYLFFQTMKAIASTGIPTRKILYINFEDERLLPFQREDWETLLGAFYDLYPENLEGENYLFLDEIQEVPWWDKFVRRVSEKKNFHLYLTGSSSKLFSREISTTLRGRTLSYFLLPFSFKEFLAIKNCALVENLEYSTSRHKIKKMFEEYLVYGGFPEVFDKDPAVKTQILQGYYDLIFYKDIVERYHIRNLTLMKELMRYLLSQFSSLFSVTAYYNHLQSSGRKTGKDTLFEYLSMLEDAHFIKTIPLFDYSLKKQTVNPKKIYAIDTGLISAGSFQFSENRGRYLENLAFLELLRKGRQIFYFKDQRGYEVDFLTFYNHAPEQLIQVSSNIQETKTREREVRALAMAAEQLHVDRCTILTEDHKEEIKEGKLTISVIPLWLWLIRSWKA